MESKANDLTTSQEVRYLLSFLAILVERNGGTLTISHLSKFASRNMALSMNLNPAKDMVTLTVEEK